MIAATLLDVIKNHFPDAALPENTDDLRLGCISEWDSFAHFSLLLSIEEKFELQFSVDDMAELKNFIAIEAAVKKIKGGI